MRVTKTNRRPSKVSQIELKTTTVWSDGGRFEQWLIYYTLVPILTMKHLGLQCAIDLQSLLPF